MNTLREIYANKARVSRHASDGDFDDNLMDFEDFEQAIADYEASKWVSVEERLPDSNWKYQEVLVVSDECFDRPYIGYYRAEMRTWYLRDDEDSIELVTHWQPLPTLPTK